jgi:transcriptional regulator with XRE-family HTH domain
MASEAPMSDGGGIGGRVRAARERRRLTREGLAYHAGVSWSAIAQVESGRRTNLRPSTLAALARPLGVSIDYLVNGSHSCPTMLEHSVFPYRTDGQFRETAGAFLREGVERSEPALAVTTAPNIELIREHLGRDVSGVEFIDANDFYIAPSAAFEAYGAFFERASERGSSWVRVLGEPMRAGETAEETRAWTQYESLFNLVFASAPTTVVCAYDERVLAPEAVLQAQLTHPSTVGTGGVWEANPGYTEPARFAFEATRSSPS